jgi:hypothetical protein
MDIRVVAAERNCHDERNERKSSSQVVHILKIEK